MLGGCERGKICEETADRREEAMGRKRVPSFWGSTRFVCVNVCVSVCVCLCVCVRACRCYICSCICSFCVSIDYFLMYYVEASCKYVVNSGSHAHTHTQYSTRATAMYI